MTPAAFARWIFFDGPRLALPFRCLVASVCVYCASCALSAPQRAAIVSIEGALCSALLPLAWPGGGSADALVCDGSQSALSAALASLPAQASSSAAGPSSPGAGPPPAMERRPVHARGKLIGFVPAAIAADVQRRLDATR